MNKVEIIRVLEDWNFWKNDWEKGIKRPLYLDRMVKYVKTGQVLVITGARRSGKSFLMKQLASEIVAAGEDKKNILFVNFEDPRWLRRDHALLDKILDAYKEHMLPDLKPYLFLDEIQEVDGWEKWVRTLHELEKATIVISGSNAKLLGKELGTVLTGRHIDTLVYPLSFEEYLLFKNIDANLVESAEIKGHLNEYLSKGSFPALAFLNDGIREWFLAYYDDVLEKDLVKRYRIRKTEELKALLNLYMSNISKPMTFHAAAKFLKISPDTVEKFASYFEQAYLLFLIKRFSLGQKEQYKSPRKIYSIDTVLSGAVGFRMSEDYGRAVENVVYLEYLRKISANSGREIFYWRDELAGRDGKEIDFVIKEGSRIVEITQVCMGAFEGETRKRELSAIEKAVSKLKSEVINVITEEKEGIEKHEFGNIHFIPLWKWLLGRA